VGQLHFEPATAERWADIETLFGERGACGGCWCMAMRLPRREWVAGKGIANKRAFKRIVTRGRAPGVLAYAGREPIGWCAVAPRADFVVLANSRVLAPLDDEPVWSITCLFIRKDWRRRGISAKLVAAAAKLARANGARIVEGYPITPSSEDMPAPFLWLGTPPAFVTAGFVEVARRSRLRPIMRKTLRRRPGR